MKKRMMPNATSKTDGPSHLAGIESNVFSKCHNIVKHCCVTRYDDGEPRQPGWITIKTLGSAWVVQIKDPDSCLSMTATQQTLDDALALADMLLGSEEAPWEPDRFLQPKPAPKKRKQGD